MDEHTLAELKRRVLAHPFQRQETYQIQGVCYVIEKSNATSTERWVLYMYPESGWVKCEAGDSIEECFEKAKQSGKPVEVLTLDQWHD